MSKCVWRPTLVIRGAIMFCKRKIFSQTSLFKDIVAITLVFTLFTTRLAVAQMSTAVIEEVVVTAAYREQGAQDVGAGIQVYSGEELERLGLVGFEDYILTVPGVSFRDQGSGNKRIGIRGISNVSANDFGAPTSTNTVGLYLNDVPIQGVNTLPDLALFDLDRVEVLKGPQGTLYGDGAMGGSIKMVLNSPDLEEFNGKVALTASHTKNGSVNFNANAAVNLPLVEKRLAARIVAGARKDEGFIDNIATGDSDINDSDAYSLRTTLLAKINDNLSAEILLMRDVSDVDEHTQVDSTLEDLEFNGLEDRFTNYEVNLFGLTLKYNLGFAEFTSVTSYYERNRDQVDRSEFGLTAVPLPRAPYTFVEENESIVEELRLVSAGDNRFDWVIGGIYRDRERFSDFALTVDELDVLLLPVGPVPFAASQSGLFSGTEYQSQDIYEKYEQVAVYGEVNYEITKALEATVGLRWYNDDNSMSLMQVPGSLFVFDPLLVETSDSGVLFKFGLSYHLSEDHLLYGSASEGYRTSAPNSNADLIGPEFAQPGSLWNYEIGAKTKWADGRVRLNAAFYYIDWSDFQALIEEFSPLFGFNLGFIDNGGDAEVYGFEVDLAAALTDDFIFGATAGYVDSEVDKPRGGFIGGQRLPNSPEWTASAYGEFRMPISSGLAAYLRMDINYVDEQATLAYTDSQPTGVTVDAYTVGNMRFGLDGDVWGIDLFIDNIWDERAELGRGLAGNGNNLDSTRFTINRARTAGIMVRRDF